MPSEVMKVASIPAITCPDSAPIDQAARAMSEHNIGCVIAVNEEREVTGILTDRDLALRAVARGLPAGTKVSEVMTNGVTTISTSASTLDAIRQMAVRQCRRLPVVDGTGRIAGVVSLDDVMKAEGAVIREINDIIGNKWLDLRAHPPF